MSIVSKIGIVLGVLIVLGGFGLIGYQVSQEKYQTTVFQQMVTHQDITTGMLVVIWGTITIGIGSLGELLSERGKEKKIETGPGGIKYIKE